MGILVLVEVEHWDCIHVEILQMGLEWVRGLNWRNPPTRSNPNWPRGLCQIPVFLCSAMVKQGYQYWGERDKLSRNIKERKNLQPGLIICEEERQSLNILNDRCLSWKDSLQFNSRRSLLHCQNCELLPLLYLWSMPDRNKVPVFWISDSERK